MRKSRSLKVVILLGVLVVAAAGAAFYYWPQIFDFLEDEAIRAERIKRYTLAKSGETLPGTPDLNNLDARLAAQGFAPGAPIFVRIFKREFELEVWLKRDGKFQLFETYPICMWSGDLGPKHKEGDRQSPEGFYTVDSSALNPASNYHRSFNLGYPNAYDRARQRTGSSLMVHGNCRSAGCYAMTDALIEEIYGLARDALRGGQESFEVHAFPFRMTDANMARYRDNPNYRFWRTLKQGYDFFETYRLTPTVAVCERRYVVNVSLPANASITPDGRCPRFGTPMVQPFVPKPSEQMLASERITMPGPKMREVANSTPIAPPAPTLARRPDASPMTPAYGLGAPMTTGSTDALGSSQ
jgi:murein L,D-transpeptidase YafK